MFETITGLPVHPLIIHAVVVLGPLAALALVAYSLVPRWRRGLRWPTLALAAISGACAWVAEESGEFLADRLEETRGLPATFEAHEEAGELAATSMWALLAVAVVVVLLLLPAGRDPRFGGVGRVLGILLAVGAAAFALYAVVNAGDTGATAVWGGTV